MEIEKQNAANQAAWAALSKEEQFYQTAENKEKESFISFPDKPGDAEGQAVNTNTDTITLDKDALKELEGQINDPEVRGCKIIVLKALPQVADDTAKKAPPKKGAAAPVGEESKPVKGEAWIDFTPFMYPGAQETTQRVFISTVPQPKEATMDDGIRSSKDKSEKGDQSANDAVDNDKVFESRHAYVHLTVRLSEAINPSINSQTLPKSSDIAKKAIKNIPVCFPNVSDAVLQYNKEIHYITGLIQKEYTNMFANEEEQQIAIPAGTGSVKSQQNNTFNSPAQRELREQRREKFLIWFNESTYYQHIRSKMKKAIFRLAVEKYNKKVDHLGLPLKQQKEQFKAELYTFLQEQMKIILDVAIDNQIKKNPNMHNDLVAT